MGKHFGKTIIAQVLQMKEQGMTHVAIGEEFGLTKIQIKRLVERYNRKNRTPVVVPKRRGRPPRRKPLTSEQDYLQLIKHLEMQVELYRSFLQATGRM
jgi:ATP-dependent RNA circularization protein (DNA/RNA ligase family)